MIAAEPNRRRTSSSAASRASLLCRSKGSASWMRAAVLEVADRDSDERDAPLLDQRHGGRQQPSRGCEDRLGARCRIGQRVRAGRPREVVEAQAKHDRAADPSRGSHPPGDPIDERDERGVDLGERRGRAAERTLRPDRAPAPASLNRPRIPVVGERVEVPSRPAAEQRHELRLAEPGDLAHGADPELVEPGRPSSARLPRGARPAAGAGRRARRPAAPAAGRPAWPPRSPPSPGTSSSRSRP